MSGDWADVKAQQWLGWTDSGIRDVRDIASLAALLREVESEEHACGDHIKARLDEQMAEVRRVVEEVLTKRAMPGDGSRYAACDEILRRLEAL